MRSEMWSEITKQSEVQQTQHSCTVKYGFKYSCRRKNTYPEFTIDIKADALIDFE